MSLKPLFLRSALDHLIHLKEVGTPLASSDIDNQCATDLVSFLYSIPEVRPRLDELLKYRYRTPNRYFLESLSLLEDDFDVTTLLRIIHQQDEDIAYLSHNLQRQESYISKFDSMAKKIDFLRRQNKRLLDRNKQLVEKYVHKTTNNR